MLMLATIMFSVLSVTPLVVSPKPSADLDQMANGKYDDPKSPGEWINGNLNPQNSHFVEGYSVPYRVRMQDLPINTTIWLTIGYDVKHSGKNAIDYLTSYNRLTSTLAPHNDVYGHGPEIVDPLMGVTGVDLSWNGTYVIPCPGDPSKQPGLSYTWLVGNETLDAVKMTLFGGTITNISYLSLGDLTASTSEAIINVTFIVNSSTAVLAWGGHIASRVDWGYDASGAPNSAGGISGSPYHMRIKDWNLGNLGNQDRSLKSAAIWAPPGTINGYKWEDLNGNGAWEAGEPALAGWNITLSGPINSWTLTDEYGYYEFTGLTDGTYTISEKPQAGWTQTWPRNDSYVVTVTSGSLIENLNFGNFKNVNITVCKLEDMTGNGSSADDNPIEEWTVMLFKDGVQYGSNQTTGSDGCYTWTNLGPGSYNVSEVVPAGWTPTSATFHDFGTVTSGGNYSFTFTNFKLGKISGYKWNDLNGNGAWEAGEPALAGWTIQLNKGGLLVAQTTTNGSGYYEFTDLMAGNYSVGEVLQVGWTQTYPAPPGNHSVTIISGAVITDKNFGNKEVIRFLKIFVDSGSLNGYTKPTIVNDTFSIAFGTKTGPAIWWIVNYTVENKDTEGHYYILWDKWGANLLILNSTPTTFNTKSKSLTLSNGKSFIIDYSGYSGYLGNGNFSANATKGKAYVTLHSGDLQEGTNPGKGTGTKNDGKAYDADVRWEIGWLNPGETAYFTVVLAPGMNPGGQLQFSSTGNFTINTGPRVRAYATDTYGNNDFLYSWTFTNQLTVWVRPNYY